MEKLFELLKGMCNEGAFVVNEDDTELEQEIKIESIKLKRLLSDLNKAQKDW